MRTERLAVMLVIAIFFSHLITKAQTATLPSMTTSTSPNQSSLQVRKPTSLRTAEPIAASTTSAAKLSQCSALHKKEKKSNCFSQKCMAQYNSPVTYGLAFWTTTSRDGIGPYMTRTTSTCTNTSHWGNGVDAGWTSTVSEEWPVATCLRKNIADSGVDWIPRNCTMPGLSPCYIPKNRVTKATKCHDEASCSVYCRSYAKYQVIRSIWEYPLLVILTGVVLASLILIYAAKHKDLCTRRKNEDPPEYETHEFGVIWKPDRVDDTLDPLTTVNTAANTRQPNGTASPPHEPQSEHAGMVGPKNIPGQPSPRMRDSSHDTFGTGRDGSPSPKGTIASSKKPKTSDDKRVTFTASTKGSKERPGDDEPAESITTGAYVDGTIDAVQEPSASSLRNRPTSVSKGKKEAGLRGSIPSFVPPNEE